MAESISDTSALVLLMGRDYYNDGAAKRFLDSLNLDSGVAMKKLCDDVWPKYGEIVKNRKHSVYRTVDGAKGARQAIILAAGYDAQALNIIEKIDRFSVIEVDMYNMDRKGAMYDSLLSVEMRKRIKTVTCDVTSKDLPASLENAGWDSGEPTVIVAEGISYYLKYEQFWDMVSQFSTENCINRIMADYMIPIYNMDAENAERMSNVFRIIGERVDLPHITMYDYENMLKRIRSLGGNAVSHDTLHTMELARTGKNTYFGENSRGGIETCSFDI